MPAPDRQTKTAWLTPLALGGCVVLLAAIWLPFLPNRAGWLGPDYAYWLPNLLAGYYWHLGSPWWAMPWFSPAECGGVPLHANPQGAYLSLPQMLAAWLGPIAGIRATFVVYAAAGCAGAWYLARMRFGCGRAASLLAAGLFTFNGLFAVRMVVGHLSFGPFMLLPAMAACVLVGRGQRPGALILRLCGFGGLLAVCVQAGTAVLLPAMMLSLLILCFMHGLAFGGIRRNVQRLAAGTALGLLLCAGKLVAVTALLVHVPRNSYPLPGFTNIAETAWVAARSVFFWPTDTMAAAIANSALRLELHEFDYRVGPVPLILLVAWAWASWRSRAQAGPSLALRQRLLWYGLVLLMAMPLALNTLLPGWTLFLKSLPIIGSSSSLLRWFAAYILPACMGGAMALDRISFRLPVWSGGTWGVAGASVLGTALLVALPGRGFYGPEGIGNYDPSRILSGFAAAQSSGRAPPIVGETQMVNADGSLNMSLARQDALTQGLSQITCYEPLFGYRLERLPKGVLHPGTVFDEIAGPTGSHLNLVDPACYVFPGANACQPGEAFRADAIDQASAFISYRPWAFAKPIWSILADWLGIITAACMLLASAGAGAALLRRGTRA